MPKLTSTATLESGAPALLSVPGSESIGVQMSCKAPTGYAVAISIDKAGEDILGVLTSPDTRLELPVAECFACGWVPRSPVWSQA